MSAFNISLRLSQLNIQISIKRIKPCRQASAEKIYRQYLFEKSLGHSERHKAAIYESLHMLNRLY